MLRYGGYNTKVFVLKAECSLLCSFIWAHTDQGALQTRGIGSYTDADTHWTASQGSAAWAGCWVQGERREWPRQATAGLENCWKLWDYPTKHTKPLLIAAPLSHVHPAVRIKQPLVTAYLSYKGMGLWQSPQLYKGQIWMKGTVKMKPL